VYSNAVSFYFDSVSKNIIFLILKEHQAVLDLIKSTILGIKSVESNPPTIHRTSLEEHYGNIGIKWYFNLSIEKIRTNLNNYVKFF